MAGADPLWGVGGVGFNVRGNLVEHVRELEMNAAIAVFVYLDAVCQVHEISRVSVSML